MREVYIHQDYTRVGLYQSALDAAGIPNFIRNQYTNNTMAELPSGLFFPTLCVLHDQDYARAMQVLDEMFGSQRPPAADWVCPRCREEVPGTFELCWQCGATRPDLVDDPVAPRV